MMCVVVIWGCCTYSLMRPSASGPRVGWFETANVAHVQRHGVVAAVCLQLNLTVDTRHRVELPVVDAVVGRTAHDVQPGKQPESLAVQLVCRAHPRSALGLVQLLVDFLVDSAPFLVGQGQRPFGQACLARKLLPGQPRAPGHGLANRVGIHLEEAQVGTPSVRGEIYAIATAQSHK